MDIHGDIQTTGGRAEHDKSCRERGWTIHHRQKRKKERYTIATSKDNGLAAKFRREDSSNWHCGKRARSKAKKQESEGGISNPEPGLGERNKGSPTGHPEASRGKTEPRG
jgi:hypothetical protein